MYDVTIIGCGVIGASLAYTLSQYRLRVLVLERENDVAMGTTKANSAIVHAGYDPENGTLMASLNIRGSAMMEDLCRTLSVKYKHIGSLVVAFNEQDRAHLERLYENGKRNGVPGLELIDGKTAREMEPNLAENVCAALYAPSAGIIDPWGLCIAEAEVAVRNGVELQLSCAVTGLENRGDSTILHTSKGDFESRFVVNCAGGWGHEISAMASGEAEWTAKPSRGEYYLLDKSSGNMTGRVIFQCPTAAGKGVLVAPTVHGNLIVGPSAQEVNTPYDRENTLSGMDSVVAASHKSIPGVDFRQSIRNFAGVRANTSENDFIIRPAKGMPQLLHVAGIKSPGLSAAPAIGEYSAELLAKAGLTLEKKDDWNGTREQIHFKDLSDKEKAAVIAKDARYGRVICRCETITEGEIVAAIHSPIPPCSIDGIKRRAGAGMGRCQGGFCGPRVLDILARQLGRDPLDIRQDGEGTYILTSVTKGGKQA